MIKITSEINEIKNRKKKIQSVIKSSQWSSTKIDVFPYEFYQSFNECFFCNSSKTYSKKEPIWKSLYVDNIILIPKSDKDTTRKWHTNIPSKANSAQNHIRNKKCWQGCGGKGTLVHFGGNADWCSHCGKQ